ncbi:MAG: nucleotidyl transferase AbiEii/AbiGii toxin family protein [Planctomycetes bacterium]|nr:nucleotidyl transferase AbiEii/AbiGii toxin family protein [Planctomycetota bacterium]
MKNLATLPAAERRAVLTNCADKLGVSPIVVEKDFWVCWLLARVFAMPTLGTACVFKGGTSLSKVFGVVDRFSEDVDLSVGPALLGIAENDLDAAPSASARKRKFEKLEKRCREEVQSRLSRELEVEIRRVIGAPGAGDWLEYEVDSRTRSPILTFAYPSPVESAAGYVVPRIRLEFGSLTDQRPQGRHSVRALLSEAAPGAFDDLTAEVVALEVERTFWEKATILHAEFHRPPGKKPPLRMARHYSDFAALWKHPAGQAASRRLELLDRVRLHKSLYFPSAWASYETALPGTLCLLPPPDGITRLRRDYEEMRSMFLSDPPSWSQVVTTLGEAETALNGR